MIFCNNYSNKIEDKTEKSSYCLYGHLINLAAIFQLISFAIGLFYSFFYNLIALIIMDNGFHIANIKYYLLGAVDIKGLVYSVSCLLIFFVIKSHIKKFFSVSDQNIIKKQVLSKKIMWVTILGIYTYFWVPQVYTLLIEPFIFSKQNYSTLIQLVVFILQTVSVFIMLILNVKSEKAVLNKDTNIFDRNFLFKHSLLITSILMVIYLCVRIFIRFLYHI